VVFTGLTEVILKMGSLERFHSWCGQAATLTLKTL
jgi:hypothetical protein